MTDKEILDFQVGSTPISEMSGLTLLQFIAKKLNGTSTYSAAAVELRMMLQGPTIGTMPPMEKVRLIRKLLSLNVSL